MTKAPAGDASSRAYTRTGKRLINKDYWIGSIRFSAMI
jgi:hypothetical protein